MDSSDIDPQALNRRRLQWQCRRGLLELDELLQHFLDQGYDDLDAGERLAFEQLMHFPDTELQAFLLGQASATDPVQQRVITAVRHAYHHQGTQ